MPTPNQRRKGAKTYLAQNHTSEVLAAFKSRTLAVHNGIKRTWDKVNGKVVITRLPKKKKQGAKS